MERNRNTPRAPGDEELRGLRGATLIARFVCELAMLAALAFWGYVVGEGVWAWLLGLAAPAAAGIVWGMFVAPGPGSLSGRRSGWGSSWSCTGPRPPAWPPPGNRWRRSCGAGGLVTSMLNEVQERRAGPDVRRR